MPACNRREFLAALAAVLPSASSGDVFVVPNFHPASCGWLTNFSKERVYCANSYLDHLDRVRDDPGYRFVLSECNNLIAIANFQPRRFEELKQRVLEGRVELVNAFFLEPTINLSGGEALVKQGIEGLRWQGQVMGVRPRWLWAIDICGMHEQMGQICAGLGLEAMVYCRGNRMGSTLHWIESPDGSRVPAISSGHYIAFSPFFLAEKPLDTAQLKALAKEIEQRRATTPAGAPVLILGGSHDYSLAPLYRGYPREFAAQWNQFDPSTRVHFATLGQYADTVLPAIRSGTIKIPTMRGGTAYDYFSFWIESPRVKTWYRRSEHALQAAEMLSTIASLAGRRAYPARQLYHAWLLMMLNMDRNTLWGAAGGMVFEHPESWDVSDRFRWVESASRQASETAIRALAPGAREWVAFNPLNWKRSDPVVLALPEGKPPAGLAAQAAPAGEGVLCVPQLLSLGIRGFRLSASPAEPARLTSLPDDIETRHYTARVDPKTGALVSLRVKPSGHEVLGGAANTIVAEKPARQQRDPGDQMQWREDRNALANSSQYPVQVSFKEGPVASVLEVGSTFYGGQPSRRLMVFYREYSRIDFVTELEDIPDRTVVVAEFPLASDIDEVRRGVPYGFSHGAWAKPNPELHGWTKGIVPAVRWSHYAFAGGGGVALLDRGLTGRELTGRIPVIFLLNASDKYYGYPNSWLSGRGKHRLEYALVAHDGDWASARIPQLAWEYNSAPVVAPGRAAAAKSWLQTSDNVIVEAVRREEGEIEIRMAECFGRAGEAWLKLSLPHRGAALTDMLGGNRTPLASGAEYRFPVRPQQIVTMRFESASRVPKIEPLLRWDELVPERKRAMLNAYSGEKGHPPHGE